MPLTYGDVPLIVPTPEICEWVSKNISFDDLVEFVYQSWPGKNALGLTMESFPSPPRFKLNSLWWPSGASRFSVGHFLVDTESLIDIRKQAFPLTIGTGGLDIQPIPLLLEMGEGGESIAARMYMLPAKPLTGVPTDNSLHLLTLVDQRYYWWSKSGRKLEVTKDTTWAQLYTTIASRLGINIQVDSISSAYQRPNPNAKYLYYTDRLAREKELQDFSSRHEPLPLLFDAIARNVGHKIVRQLSNYDAHAYTPTTSRNILLANLTNKDRLAGGVVDSLAEASTILPSEVEVVFPIYENGMDTGDVFTVSVALSSFSLFSSLKGHPGKKTFHDSMPAWRASINDVNPSNASACQTLANQIALDFYLERFYAAHDIVFSGIVPWNMEGLTDAVIWTFQPESVTTRVMRSAWNDGAEELLHWDSSELRRTSVPFPIKITGRGTGDNASAHSWTEMIEADNGEFVERPSGNSGDASADPPVNPAYGLNGEQFDNDTIAIVVRGSRSRTSELTADVSDTASVMPVLDGTVFTETGTFQVIVDSEVMTVSAVNGNSLTVSRSAPVTHDAGAVVRSTKAIQSWFVVGVGGSSGQLRVKNDSGSNRLKYEILRVGGALGPVDLPSDDLDAFKEFPPHLIGNTPNGASNDVCILLEDIDDDQSGKALVAGYVQVKIDMVDNNHEFAEPVSGDAVKLKSVSDGPIPIIWKETGTGTKWAIVEMGSGGSGGGEIIVKETDGTPSVDPCDTIEFLATHFKVTDLGGGNAKVEIIGTGTAITSVTGNTTTKTVVTDVDCDETGISVTTESITYVSSISTTSATFFKP